LAPSPAFHAYFDASSGPQALYVDVYSTGSSFSSYLFARQMRGHLFVICRADDTRYRDNLPGESDCLDIQSAFLSSNLSPRGKMGLGLEMANFACHRRVRDVRAMPGGFVPVWAAEREYDEARVAVQHRALHECLAQMYLPQLVQQMAALDTALLMKELYSALNGDAELMACFPEHKAADAAYRAALRAISKPGLSA
jgi:hypothetical protein